MRTRRLIVVTPEGERELLFIGRLSAGRAPECDISIADTKISRRHAEFDASGPIPRVTDLGSRNGILVNGRKVGSADLAPGDIVTIGDAQVRFEEQAVAPPPAMSSSASGLDDRTAVLPPMHLQAASVPAELAETPSASPPVAASVAPPVAPEAGLDLPLVPASPPPPPPPSAPAVAVAAAAIPNDDRTAVLPRPVDRRPSSGASVAPASTATPAAASPAPPVGAARPAVAVPASPATHAAAAHPPVPAQADRQANSAAIPTAAPPVVAPAAPPPPASSPSSSTVPFATAGSAVPKASGGPRMSWGGFLTILVLLLGSIGVLLGVVPILSATSTTIDALATRQARTLAGWLGSAIRSDGTVDEDIVEAVRLQDGVTSAMLVDARSGRVVAPSRMMGRTLTDLPAGGADWRTLAAPVVTSGDGTTRDAVVPVRRGTVPHVAWIRYEPASGADSGLALVVALGSTLVLALAIVLLIKRHTAATLQYFTRQVELAVSGANAKVMQGTLVPGLERLPGIVSYLLEQRRARDGDAELPEGVTAAGLSGGPTVPAVVAPPPEPAWLEITPSLSVARVSAEAPAGVAGWEAAGGRHLLDVLTDGPVRNAVVQGLGALGMAAGAEVSVPVDGQPPIALRRESSGHVRVTFATR